MNSEDKDHPMNQTEKDSGDQVEHQLDQTVFTLEIRVKDMLPDDCLPSEDNPNVTLVKLEKKDENNQRVEEDDGIIMLKNEESQVAGEESVAEDAGEGQEKKEEAGADAEMQNEVESKEQENAAE